MKISPIAVLVVLLGHLALVAAFLGAEIKVFRDRPASNVLFAELILRHPEKAISPPPLTLSPVVLDFDIPQAPLDAWPSSEIEPPRIDPDFRLDISQFAEQAQLPAGLVATVLMLLQIGADGSVISAGVIRSNGSSATDQAAIAYAMATRWLPGSIDGKPRPMQASLTVILGESS